MPVDGIPESKPIGDGQPGREGWSSGRGRPGEGQEKKPLLRGKDRVQLHSKREQALALLRHCVLLGIRESLGMEARPPSYGREEQPCTAERVAEQLLSAAGQALQEALSKGLEDAPQRLREGAARGIEEALDALGPDLEEEAGEAVTRTLDLWAEGVERASEPAP
ncbi:MAG TPA: hypothetical protein ENK02_14115 [Planctomycetes bacterium]|nr:hypothetical protein [Planctomycetota bacterium]